MSADNPTFEGDTGPIQPPSGSSTIAQDHRGLAMTALEIGVIVGTVLAFLLGLFFVFYCRQSDKANNANDSTLQRVEEGQVGEAPAVEEPIRHVTYTIAQPNKPTQWLKAVMQKYGKPRSSAQRDMFGNQAKRVSRGNSLPL